MMLSSCSHYYYAPNEGLTAGLSEKNDLILGAGTGGGSQDGESNMVLVGYSPIKHLGLQSSFFKLKADGSQNQVPQTGDGYIFNGAVGGYYFFPLNKDPARRKRNFTNAMQPGILIDLYGGYAKGIVNNDYGMSTSKFDFNKTFGQIGLHWRTQLFEINYTLKAGVLDFNTVVATGNLEEENLREIESVIKYDTYNFRESTLKVQVGIKYARVFLSRTQLFTPNLDEVRFINNTFHMGVTIEIDEIFKRIKQVNSMN